jgi:S-adenosylmethionine synthetase
MGGFDADTGLTGRKLIVDNYGPRVPVGGGAFSGKDPTKSDRSAAYMARYIAIDILKQNMKNNDKPKEVIVNLAYVIGKDQPVQAHAIIKEKRTICTNYIHNLSLIGQYHLSPKGIIDKLELRRPIYLETAN